MARRIKIDPEIMARFVDKSFYVYILFRPNGLPCYVGKGRGGRWTKHERGTHNIHLGNIIKLAGSSLPKVKVREGLTAEQANETEVAFIAAIGRKAHGGILVNESDGGEGGSSGCVMDADWRAHRSKEATKMWSDPAFRKRASAQKMGNQYSKKSHVLSEEWQMQLSKKMIGNQYTLGMKHSDTARQAMRQKWQDPVWVAALMAKRKETTYNPEVIARRAAKRVGQPVSQETRNKIALALSGRQHSEETRAKMRHPHKRRAL